MSLFKSSISFLISFKPINLLLRLIWLNILSGYLCSITTSTGSSTSSWSASLPPSSSWSRTPTHQTDNLSPLTEKSVARLTPVGATNVGIGSSGQHSSLPGTLHNRLVIVFQRGFSLSFVANDWFLVLICVSETSIMSSRAIVPLFVTKHKTQKSSTKKIVTALGELA